MWVRIGSINALLFLLHESSVMFICRDLFYIKYLPKIYLQLYRVALKMAVTLKFYKITSKIMLQNFTSYKRMPIYIGIWFVNIL